MKFNPLVLALGLIPLTGCGGGSSDSTSTTSTTYSVKAIDGYLRNAQVWLDLDGDYQLDDNEPSALSGDGGSATLDVTGIDNPGQYSVVVKAIAGQTVDEDTITETNPEGAATTSAYMMSAPAGQTIVTPLSTLVNIKMENNSSLSQDDAVAEVATELGLTDSSDVLDDYIADNQGDTAAKASSIVELEILPESEDEMNKLADGTTNIADSLTDDVTTALSSLKENQLLVADDSSPTGVATVEIVNEADASYDADALGADKDGDGIINQLDAFPDNAEEWSDTDGDNIGDNSDPDIDGDTVVNADDAFPYDASEMADNDKDLIGDNADSDDDNDGVLDTADAFPFDATETTDSDGDKVGDNADAFPNDPTETTDSDGDKVGDNADAFPNDPSETIDSDGDKVGDNADAFPNDPSETIDSDGDKVGDNADAFPNDPTETTDTDGDKVGDNADAFPNDPAETSDSDGDKVGDNADAFPNDPTETTDSDGDGTGDNSDTFPNNAAETTDTDGDGVGDNADVFPNDATETTDTDGDGIGDNSDPDADGDGVIDAPLIGTWSTSDMSFTFTDTTYSMEERDENDNSCNGTETGVYAYNAATGAITVSEITSDNNGTCGLSDMLAGTLSFTLSEADPSGNYLTFAYVDGDGSGTFTLYKTQQTSATAFFTANPNFYFLDLGIDNGELELGYDDVQWNSNDDSLTNTEYGFDFSSSVMDFVANTDEESDYILTSDGWEYVNWDSVTETLTPQTDGSMDYSNGIETETITGEEWSLSGANIAQFAAEGDIDEELLAYFDSSAEFSDGAAAYVMTSEITSDPVYSLWLDSCDQPDGFTDLPMIAVADTGLCNTQYSTTDGSAIVSIASITASTPFAETGSTSQDDFNGMFYMYDSMIRLVEGGSVDIYDKSLNPISGTVTWQSTVVNGETLITFSTADESLSEFNELFLTEYDGYVRAGKVRGDEGETELTFNGTAKDDIFDAFDVVSAATDYPASDSGDSSDGSSDTLTDSAFTTDWLDGKTLYNLFPVSENTYNGSGWELDSFTFTTTTFTACDIGDVSNECFNTPYEITEDGYIKYDDTEDGITTTYYIRALSSTDDYLTLACSDNLTEVTNTDTSYAGEYFFYDQTTAEEFVANHPIAFSTEWLADKTLYGVWYGNETDSSSEDSGVVVEMAFGSDGYITGAGLLNADTPSSTISYDVTTDGLLYMDGVSSEGNKITPCGHTSDYIRTNYLVDGAFDNVDLLFFDEQTALDYANGLTATIPQNSCDY
jgi:hypothetical protein